MGPADTGDRAGVGRAGSWGGGWESHRTVRTLPTNRPGAQPAEAPSTEDQGSVPCCGAAAVLPQPARILHPASCILHLHPASASWNGRGLHAQHADGGSNSGEQVSAWPRRRCGPENSWAASSQNPPCTGSRSGRSLPRGRRSLCRLSGLRVAGRRAAQVRHAATEHEITEHMVTPAHTITERSHRTVMEHAITEHVITGHAVTEHTITGHAMAEPCVRRVGTTAELGEGSREGGVVWEYPVCRLSF